jgi:putative hemolysin
LAETRREPTAKVRTALSAYAEEVVEGQDLDGSSEPNDPPPWLASMSSAAPSSSSCANAGGGLNTRFAAYERFVNCSHLSPRRPARFYRDPTGKGGGPARAITSAWS